jgi:hypothetical protein
MKLLTKEIRTKLERNFKARVKSADGEDDFHPVVKLFNPVGAGERIESSNHSLAYWRKFAPLHRFIVDEFANGEDDCQRIGLGRDDLIKIAEAIEGNKLPPDDDCLGFFFGSPEIWAEYRAEAKEHAAQFRAAATWFDAAPKYESGSPMQWRSVHYQAIW